MYLPKKSKKCLPILALNFVPGVNAFALHAVKTLLLSTSMVAQSTSPLMRKEDRYDVLCTAFADLCS